MTGLGMSETASNHTCLYVEDRTAAAGSVGRPIPYTEHRIVDPNSGKPLSDGQTGNIQVRGYSLMAGLYKREREGIFTPDGFYDTRDRGYFRDELLYFVERDGGLIKTAGNNVSAREVQEVLVSLPNVAAAHVVGIPDAAVGHIVGAALVPKVHCEIEIEAIVTAIKKELSTYKVPKVIRVMSTNELPFLSNGKLDERRLVALISSDIRPES